MDAFERNKDEDYFRSLGHGPSLPILEVSAEALLKAVRKYRNNKDAPEENRAECWKEVLRSLREANEATGTTHTCRQAYLNLCRKLSEREAAIRAGADIGDAAAHIDTRRNLKVTMRQEEEVG